MSVIRRQPIPTESEFQLLLEDRAFLDYFNVFLNQPVFGQRVLCEFKTNKFILDPPVTKRRYRVFENEIQDWLRTVRFPTFSRSDLFLEYNLCCRLRDTRDGFLQHMSGDLESNKDFWERTTEFLVGQVLGMQYFRQSLIDTPGDTAFRCWFDLERFRRLPTNDPERLELYHRIKENYLANGAPHELSAISKHQAFKGLFSFDLLDEERSADNCAYLQRLFAGKSVADDFTIYDFEAFTRLQNLLLAALKSYWLPRYAIHITKATTPKQFRRYCSARPAERNIEFFTGKTRTRLQTMFPDTLDDQGETLSVTPEDALTISQLQQHSETEEEEPIDPVDLLSLWGGHRPKYIPVYDDPTSGDLSDGSSKSPDGSLWTTAPNSGRSTLPMPNNLMLSEDSSESSLFDTVSVRVRGKHARTKENAIREMETGPAPVPKEAVNDITYLEEDAHDDIPSSVRYYIRGSHYMMITPFERQNSRFVTAIASDSLAGKPFQTYLSLGHFPGTLTCLQLWRDLQDYMSVDPNATDGVGRNRKQLQASCIMKRYLLTSPYRNISSLLNPMMQESLYRCLVYGAPTEALFTAQELCCQGLRPAWREFKTTDRHAFVQKVIRRDSKDKPTATTDERNKIHCTDYVPLDGRFMWRALELAAVSRIPLGLKPDYDIHQLAILKNQDFGSLSALPWKVEENAPLRNLVVPKKWNISTLKVSKVFLYKRPEIPKGTSYDTKSFQLRRNGVVIERPQKPRSFAEALTNPVHFEFFKRFLILKRAAAPLMFWKQVQELKETKNPRQRLTRVTQIFRRYFSRNAKHGAMLDCSDEIIKQIPYMERVTASMIVCAQGAVVRSLERKWFKQYLTTFPGDDVPSPLSSPTPDADVNMYDEFEVEWTPKRRITRAKTYRLWKNLLRLLNKFIIAMKQQMMVKTFWVYLKLELKKALDKRVNPLAEIKVVLQNRLIVMNKLPQDLLLWVEVTKYKEMSDGAYRSCRFMAEVDGENLRLKATAIVDCFLNSEIQPRVQVNIAPDTATYVSNMLMNQGPSRGIFHEAVVTVFPVLYHYYKSFVYDWNIANLDATQLAEVYKEAVLDLKGNSKFDSPHGSAVFPSYHHLLPEQFQRVHGPRGDEHPRINFTIAHGIRIIIPSEGGPRTRHIDGTKISKYDLQSGESTRAFSKMKGGAKGTKEMHGAISRARGSRGSISHHLPTEGGFGKQARMSLARITPLEEIAVSPEKSVS